jgi:hypothetical protein
MDRIELFSLNTEPEYYSRDSGWTMDEPKFETRYGKELSLLLPALGIKQSPIHWVTRILPPGVNLSVPKDHRLPPTIAEVKKMWLHTSTPHMSS